jgi:hypothetical protein
LTTLRDGSNGLKFVCTSDPLPIELTSANQSTNLNVISGGLLFTDDWMSVQVPGQSFDTNRLCLIVERQLTPQTTSLSFVVSPCTPNASLVNSGDCQISQATSWYTSN